MSCGDLFLALIAVIFPPLAVWVKTGLCSADSCVNILLCLLGFIPGLIHAWYIIAKYPEHDYEHIHDPERQDRVTYYVISHEQGGRHGRQGRIHGTPGYGTVHHSNNKSSSHHGGHHQPQPVHHDQHHSGHHHQPQPVHHDHHEHHTSSGSRPGPSSHVNVAPPSYNEAVRGDHKIQSHD